MSQGKKSANKRENQNTHIMRDARCPFMRESRGKAIECEGPMDEVSTGLKFASKRKLEKHAAIYCANNYRYCEVYTMVMAAKYED